MRNVFLAMGLASALILAACGKKDEAVAPAPEAAPAMEAPAAEVVPAPEAAPAMEAPAAEAAPAEAAPAQ